MSIAGYVEANGTVSNFKRKEFRQRQSRHRSGRRTVEAHKAVLRHTAEQVQAAKSILNTLCQDAQQLEFQINEAGDSLEVSASIFLINFCLMLLCR